MTFTEALKIIKISLENTATAAVKALKAHVFRVDIGEKRFEVSNLPKVQEVRGSVKVENQKAVEDQLAKVGDWLSQVRQALNGLTPPKEIRVSNFPAFPKFPSPPKGMKVTNTVKVTEERLGDVLKALGEVKQAIGKLPTKYPEVKIPPFPKIPEFPHITIPTPPKSVSVDNLERLVGDDPKQYVPVRLTDGEEFYKAIEELTVSTARNYAFSDNQGVRQHGLVDSDRHVQVDVVSMPTEDNSFNVNHIDNASATVTYYGKEDKNGEWLIQKESVSGTVTTYTFATITNNPSVSDYSSAWTARTTLTYGTYSQAF